MQKRNETEAWGICKLDYYYQNFAPSWNGYRPIMDPILKLGVEKASGSHDIYSESCQVLLIFDWILTRF